MEIVIWSASKDTTTSMSATRRDFIKATTSTAAALAVGDHLASLGADARSVKVVAQSLSAPAADAAVIDLANEALNAAREAGASYADVRIGRYRRSGCGDAREAGARRQR